MSSWEVAASSHIGGRNENQDDYALHQNQDGAELLVVVADGMGGHKGSAAAARKIVDAAREVWSRRAPGASLKEGLEALVYQSHSMVRAMNEADDGDAQSTLVALWLRDDEAVSVHVGDSRVLQYGDGQLIERTTDHSLAQLHVLAGKISEEEMASHPDQSRLITSIGSAEGPDPEYKTWNLEKGKAFIICSDGFWEIVSPKQQAALLETSNLQASLERAIHEQLEEASDTHDNTTAVVVRPTAAPTGKIRKYIAAIAVVALVGLSLLVWEIYSYYRFMPCCQAPGGGVPESSQLPKRGGELPIKTGKEQPDPAPAVEQTPKPKITQSEPLLKGSKDNQQSKTAKPKPQEQTAIEAEPGALEGLKRRVQIDYPGGEAGEQALAEWLHEAGLLNGQATLSQRPDTKTGEGGEAIRFDIYHDGLRVWGATINARVVDGRIVGIQGEVPHDIELPDKEVLPYPEALRRASEQAQEHFEAQDEATLYVFRADPDVNGYTRAWHGNVLGNEFLMVDAHTGAVLARWPAITDQSQL